MPIPPQQSRSSSLRQALSRVAFVALLLGSWITSLRAQAAAHGTAAGSVYNVATRSYLANVEVRATSTGATTVSGVDGTYSLSLPAGKHTLVFTYSGLDSKQQEVDVPAGSTVRSEVGLSSTDYRGEVHQLSEFVVASDKEGRAASIAQQREAPHMVNVISSDEFPNVAGGNV